MKKILSLLLVLTMLLSMTALAFAETGVDTNPVEKDGVKFKGTVKIGSVMCETGAVAAVGIPYSQFYRLFVRYINEEMGGIAKGADGVGYYLDHKSYDDGGNAQNGQIFVNQLINDDRVFSMVGNLGTWVLVASQNDIVESGVPSIYWGTGAATQMYLKAEGNERYTFPVQPIYVTEGRIMLLRALNLPSIKDSGVEAVKKIGVIYSADDSGTNIYQGAQLQYDMIEGEKPEIVYQMANTQSTDELATAVAAMEGVDVVIIGGLQSVYPPIYTAMQQNPNTRGIPVIVSYVNVAETYVPKEYANEADTSDIYGGAWVIIDPEAQTEEQKAELAEFAKIVAWGLEKGHIAQDMADVLMGGGAAYAMSSFIALNVFMTGMDRLADKEITREALLEAMESAPIHVPISSGVDYADGSRIGLNAMAFAKYDKGWTDISKAFITVDNMRSINELLGE